MPAIHEPRYAVVFEVGEIVPLIRSRGIVVRNGKFHCSLLVLLVATALVVFLEARILTGGCLRDLSFLSHVRAAKVGVSGGFVAHAVIARMVHLVALGSIKVGLKSYLFLTFLGHGPSIAHQAP